LFVREEMRHKRSRSCHILKNAGKKEGAPAQKLEGFPNVNSKKGDFRAHDGINHKSKSFKEQGVQKNFPQQKIRKRRRRRNRHNDSEKKKQTAGEYAWGSARP